MTGGFYRFLIALTRRMGQWVFKAVAWIIATGYFLLFPRRLAVSLRFYRILFLASGVWHHLLCSWRQYHNFTSVFLDRFLLFDDRKVSFTHEGWEYVEDAVKMKSGGVILMSHVSNWEIAAHLLLKVHGTDNPEMRLLLYLGKKHKEQIERAQKESLVQSGVKVIAVEQDEGSPFDIVEGINFLKAGGLVSLTGDRRWRADQRTVAVRFLGHEAFLPETPFIFALLSGCPLLIFFAYRTGRQTYHFTVMPPVSVSARSRKDRQETIGKAAQTYARYLEDTVRQHPFEWYHFEPFLGRKLDNQEEKPLQRGADFVYKKRPSARVMAGLFLMLFSYVIGWPAVGALGAVSLYTKNPLIVAVGGPLVYGLSHLVFLVGAYYAGKDYAEAFLRKAMKVLKERR